MSHDPYGPKRRNTARIPRASLPPTEGSVPDLAAEHWDPEAVTLEKCPVCAACVICLGKGMVTGDVAKACRDHARGEDEDA